MKLKKVFVAISLATASLISTPAISASEVAVMGDTQDVKAIVKWTDRWQRLYNEARVDEMRDMYEQDAVLMAHGGARLVGKDAILKFLGRNKTLGNKAVIDFAPEELIIEGKHAFWTAQYWLSITLANGTNIPLKGRSLLIFKKGEDQQWRLWRDMDNQASDVPDKEPAS